MHTIARSPVIVGQDEHITSAPYYPQTNGKVEALICTALRECLDLVVAQRQREGNPITTLAELQGLLDQWVIYYNYRWHSAIKDKPVVTKRECNRCFVEVDPVEHELSLE